MPLPVDSVRMFLKMCRLVVAVVCVLGQCHVVSRFLALSRLRTSLCCTDFWQCLAVVPLCCFGPSTNVVHTCVLQGFLNGTYFVLFGHSSPSTEVSDVLTRRGVDYCKKLAVHVQTGLNEFDGEGRDVIVLTGTAPVHRATNDALCGTR